MEFLRSREGLELNKAFVRISDAKARRAIVELVRSLADDETNGRVTAGCALIRSEDCRHSIDASRS